MNWCGRRFAVCDLRRASHISPMPVPDLRPVEASDLLPLSALVARSKAHWGYDLAFLRAHRAALTLTVETLAAGPCVAAVAEGRFVGAAWLVEEEGALFVDGLFVDPPAIGTGAGRVLFDWCAAEGRRLGFDRLVIEADPNAAGFYERMGAERVGEVASEPPVGRVLPVYHFAL